MSKEVRKLLILLFVCCNAYSSHIIRDSEVEAVIKELTQPLFNAAGLDGTKVKIFIINDDSINAFVIANNSIFIHLGLLRYSTEPYVLLGILAHEIAHISAGHILQINNAMNYFNSVAMLSYALGLVSGIAINPEVASAVVLGGISIGARLFSNYSQEQESVADSYAVKYLDQSGYDNIGIKEAFSYFKNIEDESYEQYFRTHPLNDKRLFAVNNYRVKYNVKQIPLVQLLKFKRAVVKLDAFFTPIYVLLRKYKDNEYVNSIIHYRQGKIDSAIEKIDSLMRDDPYLYELKAEMLYKAGKLVESIENYEHSLKCLLTRDDYLVKLSLVHTLILHGDIKKAIFYLEQMDEYDIVLWKYFSVAYKLNNNMAMYYFSLTKKAFLEGNFEQFTRYSKLAIDLLSKNSSYLLQIEDMKKQNRF